MMRYKVTKQGRSNFLGDVELPTTMGTIRIQTVGADPASAALRAAAMAQGVMDNQYVKAFIPPQAQLAVNALRSGASAVKKGGRWFRSLFGGGGGKRKHAQAVARQLRIQQRKERRIEARLQALEAAVRAPAAAPR